MKILFWFMETKMIIYISFILKWQLHVAKNAEIVQHVTFLFTVFWRCPGNYGIYIISPTPILISLSPCSDALNY